MLEEDSHQTMSLHEKFNGFRRKHLVQKETLGTYNQVLRSWTIRANDTHTVLVSFDLYSLKNKVMSSLKILTDIAQRMKQ